MIELSRHIESLLLQHDCVIIPGLGGFITQYVPARRVADEQILLPPYRSVGFNQQLTLNDGLLVQSYMQAYDTNYPETIKLINEAVHQLKETLQEKGEYTLSGIGCLSLGIGGQYNFTPCEAGVLSPDLYGLDALTLKEIHVSASQENQNENSDKSSKTVQIKRSEKNYTISISREIVNYAASIAVAIFFYFLWATPVTPSNPQDIQASSIIHKQLFANEASAIPQSVKPSQTDIALKVTEVKKAVEAEKKTIAVEANAKPEKPIAPQPAVQAQGKYTLVLVSAITQDNAEEYAERLNKQGFGEAYPYKRGNMIRVVYGNYQTEDEAHQALKELHKQEQFADAWILRK